MQFSYHWLQDFFDSPLPPAEEVAEELGLHSFELEGVEEAVGGDVLIDWDILPNRSSDCLSYAGIAREIAAVCNLPLKTDLIPSHFPGSGDCTSEDRLDFTLHTNLVPRATKRYVEGVVVKDSPPWLQEKLSAIGQKSINNVVDVTNYVMWMTGQPVHAFDYDKLAGQGDCRSMSIRPAGPGEAVRDLTGTLHQLDETMLVVADQEKALDVAGIKGGENSGVDEDTTRVIISACVYDYQNIRQTSRSLKLHSDASKRYENEVPLHKAQEAQALCAQLLEEECGAQAAQTVIDTLDMKPEAPSLEVSLSQVNALLGLSLETQEVEALLARLNFTLSLAGDILTVTPPLERLDVTIAEDVIEEVGRLYGLYNLPETPLEEGFAMPQKNMIKQSWYRTGDVLVGMGFYEIYNRSLVGDGVVILANALNTQANTLRSSLLPLLKKKVERNLAHTDTPHFFEIGKVFTGLTDGRVDEHWSFAGVLGRRTIKEKEYKELFLETKGVLETVCEALHVSGLTWKEAGENSGGEEADGPVAVLELGGTPVGMVGVNWWELNFEALVAAIDTNIAYREPSLFPTITRDLAVWVPLSARVGDVQDIIEQVGAEACVDLALFDVFEDQEHGRKSLAFRMVFQSWKETLTDEGVNEEMMRVYQALEGQPGFAIR